MDRVPGARARAMAGAVNCEQRTACGFPTASTPPAGAGTSNAPTPYRHADCLASRRVSLLRGDHLGARLADDRALVAAKFARSTFLPHSLSPHLSPSSC